MARTFDPARHPRDKRGRFTKSRTVKASAKDKQAARLVADAFRPVQAADRSGYLRKVAGDDRAGEVFGQVGDANRELRTGRGSAAADALDQAMIDLPDDVLLSRRVPLSAFGSTDPASLQGMKVRDAGFAPAQLGTVQAGTGQVRMHIAVPAGTRAAVDPDTGEVILDRDTEMVVARVEEVGGGHDMWLTVLPKVGAKQGTSSPDTAEGADKVRADLMKLKVPELQAQMRERGLKPGRLRKTQLIDALIADETGGEQEPETPPAGDDLPASFDDRLAVAAVGDAALHSAPLSLTREDTHARTGNRAGLTAQSREALLDYQGYSFMQINGALRGTLDKDAPNWGHVQEQIGALDAAMNDSRLPADVVTYRGVRYGRRIFGDRINGDLTGMRWREDAYLSTSTELSVPAGFTRGTVGVQMRILVPAGVSAVQVSERVDGDGHDDEAELLIARGQTLQVVADRGVDADGVRVLDVEVIAGG